MKLRALLKLILIIKIEKMKNYKTKIYKGKSKIEIPFKMFIMVILKKCLWGWIKSGDVIKAMKNFINIHIKFNTIRGYKNWNLGKRFSIKFFEYFLVFELRNVSNTEMCQDEYEYDNNI
jgi:hypothetical protein